MPRVVSRCDSWHIARRALYGVCNKRLSLMYFTLGYWGGRCVTAQLS